MTVSATITCSTCGHKVRVRFQVGFISPVVVKIACAECGKLIKGLARTSGKAFDFPDDHVLQEYTPTTQTVSISSEFPIVNETANTNSMVALTPFMAMGEVLPIDKIQAFARQLQKFTSLYDAQFSQLKTACEIFENRKWRYFLLEAKKNFSRDVEEQAQESFEDSAASLVAIMRNFYQYLSTPYYEREFNQVLRQGTIDPLSTQREKLIELKAALETHISIEGEFIKGMKLFVRFLENIKSFVPVISLSYNDDWNREYTNQMSITTFEFLDLKEMYIEQFEYLARISSVYFGLHNLSERNDFNDFGGIAGCRTLHEYLSKDNGIKKDIIKREPLLDGYFGANLNSQLRNGIGHLKTVYDTREQLIKYFPFKDIDRINEHREIYLIDFAIQVFQQALKMKDSLEILAKLVSYR